MYHFLSEQTHQMCSGFKVTYSFMMNSHVISISLCVIGSLICNQSDKLHICHNNDPIFTV